LIAIPFLAQIAITSPGTCDTPGDRRRHGQEEATATTILS
jgi:hypothetical protein